MESTEFSEGLENRHSMAGRTDEAEPLADYGKRQKLKEQNRVALIEATLESIAEIGFARTSVSEIIDRAKLSRGMIHLHFGGKDALVEAAAIHSRDEYYDNLTARLDRAGPVVRTAFHVALGGVLPFCVGAAPFEDVFAQVALEAGRRAQLAAGAVSDAAEIIGFGFFF